MLKQHIKHLIIFSHRKLEKYPKLYRCAVVILKHFIPEQYKLKIKRAIVRNRPLDQLVPVKEDFDFLTTNETKMLNLLTEQYRKTFS